jgi:hypothetical protein
VPAPPRERGRRRNTIGRTFVELREVIARAGGDKRKARCGAFLSKPRFEKLPALFEGPGTSGQAPDKVDVDTMNRLRANGLRARKRRRR